MDKTIKRYIEHIINRNIPSYFSDSCSLRFEIINSSSPHKDDAYCHDKQICDFMCRSNILGATFLYFDSATNKPYPLIPKSGVPVIKDDHTVIRMPYSFFFSSMLGETEKNILCTPETEHLLISAIHASYPSVDLRSDYSTPLFMSGIDSKNEMLFRNIDIFYNFRGSNLTNTNNILSASQSLNEEPIILVSCPEIVFILVRYIKAMTRWLHLYPRRSPTIHEDLFFHAPLSFEKYFTDEMADRLESFILSHRHGGKSLAYQDLLDSEPSSIWKDSPAAKMLTSNDPSLLTPENFYYLHQNLYFPLLPYLVLYCDTVLNDSSQQCLPAHLLLPVCNLPGFEVQCQGKQGIVPRSNIMYALVTLNEMIDYETPEEQNDRLANICGDLREIGETIFIHSLRKRSNVEIQESRKGEISRLFLRNFQHNIGSHVLSHYNSTHELKDVDIEELTRLIGYVNDRNAYCNEAVRGTPPLRESYSLHHLINEFKQQKLLLKHISGRGYNFPFHILDNTPHDDILIDLPGGFIGKQAFFNILENIIRNTAKHSVGKTADTPIDFVILADPDDHTNLVKISIYSTFQESDMENNAFRINFIQRINSYIDEPLIDPVSGLGRDIHLGLTEMKCAAAFLQGHDVSKIDAWQSDETEQTRFLTAFAHGNYNLGYIFYMLKPKDLLIINPTLETDSPAAKGSLAKLAEIMSPTENNPFSHPCCLESPGLNVEVMSFDLFYKKLFSEKTIFPHKFIVCPDFLFAMLAEDYPSSLPLRILPFSIFNQSSTQTITQSLLWEKWFEFNTQKCKFPWSGKWELKYIANGPGEEIATFFDHLEKDDEIISLFHLSSYAEALPSAAQQWLPAFQNYDSMADWILEINDLKPQLYQLLESVNTSIAIIDERIQDAAYQRSEYNIPLYEHFDKSGIHIPDPAFLDLQGGITSSEIKLHNLEKLDYFLQQHNSDTFFLIHYGYLERLIDDGDHRRQWINSLCNTTKARIIIMSGRGLPSGLPLDVAVVDWHSVSIALLDIRSKHLLSNLLYNSRQLTL